MNDDWQAFDQRVSGCRLCHENRVVKALADEGKFRYRWTPWRSHHPPYRFIFVAMEPNHSETDTCRELEPSPLSAPLHFAIETFLFKDAEPKNYLITNMAKCVIPDSRAAETRPFRYENCAPYLRAELGKGGNGSCLVSIGKAPKGFLEGNRARYGLAPGAEVPWILHYGQRNTARFKEFAQKNLKEYEKFTARFKPLYLEFLVAGEEQPEELRTFRSNPDPQLWRIFLYSHRMATLRESCK